jgi:hypothetical protein
MANGKRAGSDRAAFVADGLAGNEVPDAASLDAEVSGRARHIAYLGAAAKAGVFEGYEQAAGARMEAGIGDLGAIGRSQGGNAAAQMGGSVATAD